MHAVLIDAYIYRGMILRREQCQRHAAGSEDLGPRLYGVERHPRGGLGRVQDDGGAVLAVSLAGVGGRCSPVHKRAACLSSVGLSHQGNRDDADVNLPLSVLLRSVHRHASEQG